MAIPEVLLDRYNSLFRFYDRQNTGVLTLGEDFAPAARRIEERWRGTTPPFPNLLQVLLSTYAHEQQRRDRDGDGCVNLEEFLASHEAVLAAYRANPEQSRAFIERAAGGFFDVLDLDGDGALEIADLEAFAAAYGHSGEGIAANLNIMLAELGLPPERLPRQAFLTLVEQYWFDASPTTPGRRLFGGLLLSGPLLNQQERAPAGEPPAG
jgi:hypothetical protein